MIDTIKAVLENTQNRTPMVHSITNNVTINDCANIILAAGGTAIMAQDEREVEEITSHAQALVINMGAVRAQEAMLRAAKIAKRNGRPVVLAVSTNDGLSASAESIGKLLNRKHYYFVPFGQDDPEGKPCSLVADMNQLRPALEAALQGRQLQPLLLHT